MSGLAALVEGGEQGVLDMLSQLRSGDGKEPPANTAQTNILKWLDELNASEQGESVQVPPSPSTATGETKQVTPQGKQQLILDESSGKDRLSVYTDSRGIPTIGHGFNLQDSSNQAVFEEITGLKAADAIAGKVSITPEQQEQLLNYTVERAEEDARKLAPNLDELPTQAKDALVNFVFNTGYGTASQFKKMFAAVRRGDGETAAKEVLDSAYARQVGPRAQRIASALATIGST